MEIAVESFGDYLRWARERRGLSPKRLADAIGRSPSAISRLENDEVKTPPPPEQVALLAKVLRVPEIEFVRRIGYLSTDADQPATVPAFASDDPRLEIIELLADIPDREVPLIRAIIEQAIAHTAKLQQTTAQLEE